MRRRSYKASVDVYPTDADAAKALLIKAGALRQDREGRITKGSESVRDAYAIGVIAIFEGRLKIENWHSKRKKFAATIAEIHGELCQWD